MDQILRRPDVQRITGLARSTIYEMVARGEFPLPVRLTRRAVGWRHSDIIEWLDARTAERDARAGGAR